VAYLCELVLAMQRESKATFFIITHNIEATMRVADYMGVLFRSHLVRFASKAEMLASDDPVITQFLAGRPDGPIGMDEMADSEDKVTANGRHPVPNHN
jgi:phospholipid/cholesterol/gamma-HCH transport system ATP-binding protein